MTRLNRPGVEYEYRQLSFGRETSRNDTRVRLTEEAEYGRWELARTRIGIDGKKTVWLRRRIIRIAAPML